MKTFKEIIQILEATGKPLPFKKLQVGQSYKVQYKSGKSLLNYDTGPFKGFMFYNTVDNRPIKDPTYDKQVFKSWAEVEQVLGSKKIPEMIAKLYTMLRADIPDNTAVKRGEVGIVAMFENGNYGEMSLNKSTWHHGHRPIKYFEA